MSLIGPVLALFEKIMRELWVAGLVGGALGGLVVLLGNWFVRGCVLLLLSRRPSPVPSPPPVPPVHAEAPPVPPQRPAPRARRR